MALIVWQFWIYSFFGYLLEKLFAAATHAEKRTRKCFLLLPLCPVYGLAVLVVMTLTPILGGGFWGLVLWGGVVATVVEYVVHWWYDHFFHVRFWDYSNVRGNWKGRVCLPFSLAWGLLLATALSWVQPALVAAITAVPSGATYGLLLLSTADAVCALRILQVTADTEALCIPTFLRVTSAGTPISLADEPPTS